MTMTHDMGTTLFPSLALQVLCCLLFILVSRRITIENIDSFSSLAYVSPARICLCLVFITSWLFVSTGAVLIFGVGVGRSTETCSLSVIICLAFYVSSKALIYAFLVEKAHIVWTPITGHKRTSSVIFLGCATLLLVYVAIAVVLFVGRIAKFQQPNECMLGLRNFASIPLIAYDLVINTILTFLFLWPIIRARITNPAIRSIALRTVTAATIALISSAVNIIVLTILHGQERGWLLFSSCAADVCLNATALSWVAKGKHSTLRAPRERPKVNIPTRIDSTIQGTPNAPIPPATPFALRNPERWVTLSSKAQAAEAILPPRPRSAGTNEESPLRSHASLGPLERLFRRPSNPELDVQITVTHEYQQSVESVLHQLEVGDHDDVESYHMREVDITAMK